MILWLDGNIELAGAVDIIIAWGKNIYILIIKIKWDFPFVFLWCFWKEKKSFSPSFYLNRNTHQLSASATSIDPKSVEINTFKTLMCQYFNGIRESVLYIILSTLKKWGRFLQLMHCKWYHQPMSQNWCLSNFINTEPEMKSRDWVVYILCRKAKHCKCYIMQLW